MSTVAELLDAKKMSRQEHLAKSVISYLQTNVNDDDVKPYIDKVCDWSTCSILTESESYRGGFQVHVLSANFKGFMQIEINWLDLITIKLLDDPLKESKPLATVRDLHVDGLIWTLQTLLGVPEK